MHAYAIINPCDKVIWARAFETSEEAHEWFRELQRGNLASYNAGDRLVRIDDANPAQAGELTGRFVRTEVMAARLG